jgi:hypothetical protein
VPAAATARGLLIEVSLKPGQSVAPDWPFEQLAHDVPDPMLVRNAGDERERLAAIITSPRNDRFTQVIANRLWKRYLGWGLVEPADDWDSNKPSHPRLLAWLGHELAVNGYDLKHLARLIFNSHAYQRSPVGDAASPPSPDRRVFAGPARRRMSAEQVVDSLFVAAGKPFNSEPMNLDVDGRRPMKDFLNLGTPTRAWQFASLSNERDRPALSMPMAQDLIDVLKTFGWRETRQDPITTRDQTPTMLQPLVLANSIAGHRATTLSEDHALTAAALRDVRLDELINEAFRRVLSRRATDEEMQLFASLLSDGFGERIDPDAPPARQARPRHAVSWSNHLSAEASRIKLEVERAARAGDPPTNKLRADWRRRMEDMVWTLVNSPEFVFVP